MARRNIHCRAYLTCFPGVGKAISEVADEDLTPPRELCPRPPTNASDVSVRSQAQFIEEKKDIKGIIKKYNRQIGYLKKYYARSDAQAQVNELLLENPDGYKKAFNRRASQDVRQRASDQVSVASDYSERLIGRHNLPPITAKHSSNKEGTKRGKSVSRVIEGKFQNIFAESETSSPVFLQYSLILNLSPLERTSTPVTRRLHST